MNFPVMKNGYLFTHYWFLTICFLKQNPSTTSSLSTSSTSLPSSQSSNESEPIKIELQTPFKVETAPADAFSPSDDLPLVTLRSKKSSVRKSPPFVHAGFHYHLKYDGCVASLYYCSHKKAFNCEGRVKMDKKTGEIVVCKEHSDECIKAVTNEGTPVECGVLDASDFQRKLIAELANEHSMTAGMIHRQVMKECEDKYGTFHGLRKRQVSTELVTD